MASTGIPNPNELLNQMQQQRNYSSQAQALARSASQQGETHLQNNDVAQGLQMIDFASGLLGAGIINHVTDNNLREQALRREKTSDYAHVNQFLQSHGQNALQSPNVDTTLQVEQTLQIAATKVANQEIANQEIAKFNMDKAENPSKYSSMSQKQQSDLLHANIQNAQQGVQVTYCYGDRYKKNQTNKFHVNRFTNQADNGNQQLTVRIQDTQGNVTFKTQNFKDIKLGANSNNYEAKDLGCYMNHHSQASQNFDHHAMSNLQSWQNAVQQDPTMRAAGVLGMSDRKLVKNGSDEAWCKAHNISKEQAQAMVEFGQGHMTESGKNGRNRQHSQNRAHRIGTRLLHTVEKYYGGDCTRGVMKIATGVRTVHDAIGYGRSIRDMKLSIGNNRATKTISRLETRNTTQALSPRQQQKLQNAKNKKDRIEARQNRIQERRENSRAGKRAAEKDKRKTERLTEKKAKKTQKKKDRLEKRQNRIDKFNRKHPKAAGRFDKIRSGFNDNIGKLANTRVGKLASKLKDFMSKKLKALKKALKKLADKLAALASGIGMLKIIVVITFFALLIIPTLLADFLLVIAQMFSFSCFLTTDSGDTQSYGEAAIENIKDYTVTMRDNGMSRAKGSYATTLIPFYEDPYSSAQLIIGNNGVTVIPCYYNSKGELVSETTFYQTREILSAIQLYTQDDLSSKDVYDLQVSSVFNATHNYTGASNATDISYCNMYTSTFKDMCTNQGTVYHNETTANSSAQTYGESFPAVIDITNVDTTSVCNNYVKKHDGVLWNGLATHIQDQWFELDGYTATTRTGDSDCVKSEKIYQEGETRAVYATSMGTDPYETDFWGQHYLYIRYAGGIVYLTDSSGNKITLESINANRSADNQYNTTSKVGALYTSNTSGNQYVMATRYYNLCNDYLCGGHNGCKGHMSVNANFKVYNVYYTQNGSNKLLDTSEDIQFFTKSQTALDNLTINLSTNILYAAQIKNTWSSTYLDMTNPDNVDEWDFLSEIDWEDVYGISYYDASTGTYLTSIEPLTSDQLAQVAKQAGGEDTVGYNIVNWANSQIGAAYVFGAKQQILTTDLLTTSWSNPNLQPYMSSGSKNYNDTTLEGLIQCYEGGYGNNWMGCTAYDCSNFVYYALSSAGLSVSYQTATTWRTNSQGFTKVSISDLKPGDICVQTGDNHMGIYAGIIDGQPMTIEAYYNPEGVCKRSLTSDYTIFYHVSQ